MAIYCIMSKWVRVQSTQLQEIEKKFTEAAHHFEVGDPAKKVEYLRPFLLDAVRLGVQIKTQLVWSMLFTLSLSFSRMLQHRCEHTIFVPTSRIQVSFPLGIAATGFAIDHLRTHLADDNMWHL